MKKTLFFLLICFCSATMLLAQHSNNNTLVADASIVVNKSAIKVYPNPATNFIGVRYKGEAVKSVVVYNLLGRKIKSFVYAYQQKYNITSLPKGMYLVQLLGHDNKVIKTQRLSKR